MVNSPPANAGDVGSTPWVRGRIENGIENGNLPQYSCLEKPMDREAWRAIVHRGRKDLDMTEQLSTWPNRKKCWINDRKNIFPPLV